MSKQDYYADRERLAIYLEIEWSDYLLGRHNNLSYPPNPTADVVPPYYYRELAKLVSRWCVQGVKEPSRSFGEIGGGTGRLTFEIANQIETLEKFCFVEPSESFFQWARRILTTTDDLPPFPPIDSDQDRLAAGRPSLNQKLKDGLSMHNVTLEELEGSVGQLDIVVSSNVIDRHKNPREFMKCLTARVAPGGMLVVASPLDFLDTVTAAENRVNDLNELFDDKTWLSVGEAELAYSWRKWSRPRTWVGFSSQVVAKRRTGG